jgi:hypothetical protein
MELLGDVCPVEAHFVLLGDSVNLGVKYTISTEIFLAALVGPPR